jgi:hypothetical protein
MNVRYGLAAAAGLCVVVLGFAAGVIWIGSDAVGTVVAGMWVAAAVGAVSVGRILLQRRRTAAFRTLQRSVVRGRR